VLAGVHFGDSPAKSEQISVATAEPRLGGLSGLLRSGSRDGTTARRLKPLPGTEVIGVWPDGSAAMTRRPLGRGFVYCLGTNVYPGEVIAGLTRAQGLGTYASAEGGCDLLRTCRSNNGVEDLLMVRGKDGKEATIHWTLEYPPARIYDPVTGRDVPARIEGHTATIALRLDDWDFTWLAARRPGASEHFAHWFKRQTEMWSGLVLGAKVPRAPLYRHLDLNHNWRVAHAATWEQAQALLPQDDRSAALKPATMILWDDKEKAAGPSALYRQDFLLPPAWEKQSVLELAVRGDVRGSRLHGFQGKNAIYLNGRPCWSGGQINSLWLDVTPQARPGSNRLEIVHQGPGLMPSIVLVRSAVPDRTVDLSGQWRCVKDMHAESAVSLPGEARGAFLYRDVEIPKEAARHEVWLRVEPFCPFAIINGRVRYWDVGYGPVFPDSQALEIDITPDLRFGQTNRIILGTGAVLAGWQIADYKVARVELRCYAPGKWSADGKGTRQALSPQELATVVHEAELVRQYRPIVAAQPATLPPVTPPAAATAPLPGPVLDLAAGPDGQLVDRGLGKIQVRPQGTVTPVADAGGRIRAVYLRGEGPHPGTLELPTAFFRDNIARKDFTVRVWLMPIAVQTAGGTLLNWGQELEWQIENSDTQIRLPSVPARRQVAGTVIAQRRWQCLALVVKGRQSDLYLNGIAISRQTWNRSIEGTGAPVYIGSFAGRFDFLNAKLAALAIYSEALSPPAVGSLYRSECGTYRVQRGAYYPENDLFHLNVASGRDEADIPSEVTVGPGVRFAKDRGRAVMDFDGKTSHILVHDQPRERLVSKPYALILDFLPEPGAHGTLLRRHHANCVSLDADGTLVFDANIGRLNMVRVPKAIRFGQWNRIVLTYNGRKVRLEVNGRPIGERAYQGTLYDPGGEFPLVFLADNTYPGFPQAMTVRCRVRELRMAPLLGE
jgi:hypothetical protein